MKVGDIINIPVPHIVVALGGEPGKEEVSLTPVEPHVTHVTKKLSDITAPAPVTP